MVDVTIARRLLEVSFDLRKPASIQGRDRTTATARDRVPVGAGAPLVAPTLADAVVSRDQSRLFEGFYGSVDRDQVDVCPPSCDERADPGHCERFGGLCEHCHYSPASGRAPEAVFPQFIVDFLKHSPITAFCK